jgi:hypothetical protein
VDATRFSKTTTEIRRLLKVRQSGMRVGIRQSSRGNAVLEFTSGSDKDEAKALLKEQYPAHKIRDPLDRKVAVWVLHATAPDDNSREAKEASAAQLEEDLRIFNPALKTGEWSATWVGQHRPKLRLLAPATVIVRLLKEGYVFTEGIRHPIKLMPPLPTRCRKCLRFGCHSERCRNKAACPHCAEDHGDAECPVKDDNSKKSCAACKHYQLRDELEFEFSHGALDSHCPAWNEEKERLAREQTEMLWTLNQMK